MTDPTRLIDRYLDGLLPAEKVKQLEHDLASNPKYADAFAHAMMIDSLMAQRFEHDAIASALQLKDGSFFGEDDLSVLQDSYDHAQTDVVTILDLDKKVARQPVWDVSLSQTASTLSYELKRLIRSKPMPFVGTLAAAVILLALWLINPFAGTEQAVAPPSPDIAEAPTQDTPPTVATLTATHNAQWTRQQPSEDLRSGDRLTLTAGFAEITTNSGAVAILEAPATFELTNNNNAIRLHTGKLVGICETASSLGFTVYTPDGRLIDTGTRFGVIHEGTTRVRVIEGEVVLTAKHSGAATPSTPLSAGQTARIAADQSDVIVEPIDDPRFVSQWGAIADAPKLEGAIAFEPAMPIALGANQNESDKIKVYLERSGLILAEDAVVTITASGAYDTYEDLAERVAAGLVVDSYFVHLDPQGNENATAVFHATVQFDRPILGIIATGEHVAQSHKIFGLAGVTYASTNDVLAEGERDPSGAEASEIDPSLSDRIRLSEDRRTLTLDLYCGLAVDQFRVLVASEPETH